MTSAGIGPPDPAPRLRSLDGIRGIAAVIVVLFHVVLTWRSASTGPDAGIWAWLDIWPIRLLWGGYEAVMVFFVMSGFVLALPFLGPRRPRWGRFAARRIVRLYPAYFFALLLSAASEAALSARRTDKLVAVFHGYWAEDVTFASLMQGALMTVDYSNINGAFWSLVHEIRISLIFPILFAAISRIGVTPALILTAILSATTVYLVPLFPHAGFMAGLVFSFFKTGYFLFFFVLGIALAMHRQVLVDRLCGPWRSRRAALAILGLGLMGMNTRLPYETGSLAVGLGFAMVLLVVLSTQRGVAMLQSAMPQFLGKISYSLYLVHTPVLYAACYLLYGEWPIVLILLPILPITGALAWLFWFLIERPSIAWSRRVPIT